MDKLGVALVTGSAAIDGGTTRAAGVLSHMWLHTDAVHLGYKAPGVVVLVSTDGFLVDTGKIHHY
jgi:hypothetical protein